MAVVRVIGCGNPDAGDDAAGLLAVAEARPALESLPGVEVIPKASPLEVVHLLEGADAVVVVDAIRTPGSGRDPGTVVRAEAGPEGLPAEIRSSLSSHGLGVAEAIALAAAIGPAPRVIVLGVEAQAALAGEPVSDPVRAALPALRDLLVRETEVLLAGPEPEVERSLPEGSSGPSREVGIQPP